MRFLPVLGLAGLLAAADNPVRYDKEGKLLFPDGYREWVFLSSGLGMTYGQPAGTPENPPFDNVFVNREAYRHFVKTGRWPDKTMLLLEIRSSTTHGSINKAGKFQTAARRLEAAVKDTSRFKEDGWAYFDFANTNGEFARTGTLFERTASCYGCHGKVTAVENTFVQFYPTLYPIAEKKGTLNPGFGK